MTTIESQDREQIIERKKETWAKKERTKRTTRNREGFFLFGCYKKHTRTHQWCDITQYSTGIIQ